MLDKSGGPVRTTFLRYCETFVTIESRTQDGAEPNTKQEMGTKNLPHELILGFNYFGGYKNLFTNGVR